MTPLSTQCMDEPLTFAQIASRRVTVDFEGGTITSDAGLILIAELDLKRQITNRFAACFEDYRDPRRIDHSPRAFL